MKSSFVFKRKKYIVNSFQYRSFINMQKYIEKDKYEKHTICNIYYDTQDYELIILPALIQAVIIMVNGNLTILCAKTGISNSEL